MSYTSTAKQRLWLACVGYDVPEDATGPSLRPYFDSRTHFKDPPNQVQHELAALLGVDIAGAATQYEAAGPLYQVLLLRAWVYSVWRAESGEQVARHQDSILNGKAALAIAQEMRAAGLFEGVDQIATTDAREGDVWYRMSKKAQTSAAYRFVVERLGQQDPVSDPVPAPRQPRPKRSDNRPTSPWDELDEPARPSRRERNQPARGRGCLGVVVIGLSIAGACGAWLFG